MGRLTDLRVERVDGVDKPATAREWVIIKSEDSESEALRPAIEAVLSGLTKESLSEETREQIRALAELVEYEIEFGAPVEDETEKSDECDDCEDCSCKEEKAEETEEPETVEEPTPSVEEIVEQVFARFMAKVEAEAAEVTKAKATASRQPSDDEVAYAKQHGRPSFENVIYGQDKR